MQYRDAKGRFAKKPKELIDKPKQLVYRDERGRFAKIPKKLHKQRRKTVIIVDKYGDKRRMVSVTGGYNGPLARLLLDSMNMVKKSGSSYYSNSPEFDEQGDIIYRPADKNRKAWRAGYNFKNVRVI